MLKIGIIGLGDIAQKAYLPIISKSILEVHLCTRNISRLKNLNEQYRFTGTHANVDSLIDTGITAAFVHTATESHVEIVERLLKNKVHVFVDKPLAYDYRSAKKLTDLAEEHGKILMTGFNRRYIPTYVNASKLSDINMVIMQKNRSALPGEDRKFVFDDFIHVVDTLRFVFAKDIVKVNVQSRRRNNLIHHITLQLTAADGLTAIGIMNRDSATTEEKLEVFAPSEKHEIYNITEHKIHKAGSILKMNPNDWTPTLYHRGFEQMIEAFLQAVNKNNLLLQDGKDSLETHKLCERIVEEIQK